jgi:hypothetical protein
MILLTALPSSWSSFSSTILSGKKVKDLKSSEVASAIYQEESLRVAQRSNDGINRVSQTTPRPKKCDHCGGTNHVVDNCWKLHGKPDNKGKGKAKGKGKGKAKEKEPDKSGDSSKSVNKAITSTTGSSVSNDIIISLYSLSDSSEKTSWLMDSGCTMHTTSFKSDFIDYKDLPKNDSNRSQCANGAFMTNVGVGKVMLQCPDFKFELTDVIYCPEADGRFIATRRFDDIGLYMVQGENCMQVVNEERIMKGLNSKEGTSYIHAPWRGNSYWWDAKVIHSPIIEPSSSTSQVKTVSSDGELWHKRFGHVAYRTLKHLPKMVKGVPSVLSPAKHLCEGCALGKAHKHSYHVSEKRATKPLEVIHSDLMGPFPSKSIQGNSYTVSFFDEHTGLGGMTYISTKDQALAAFKAYKAWAENQSKFRIL